MKEKQKPALSAVPDVKKPALHGLWSGTISFSLVAIPVALVRAVTPGRVSFRMLHRTDNSPLLRRMVCPEEGTIVPPEEIVRGYEIGSGAYLMITEEELESVSPERSRTIEIVEFITMSEVDPLYYSRPYYLMPLKGGEKSYSLLAEVMRRTGKAGLAKFVMGEREYLVAVRSVGGALSLITLHYNDEILAGLESPSAKEDLEPGEMSLLEKSVSGMVVEFKPDRYDDERRSRIHALLKMREKEHAVVQSPVVEEEEEGEGPADLVSMLKQSMERMKKR